MFNVLLEKSQHIDDGLRTHQPDAYLLEFASFIIRTVPDAEVHARLGTMAGDEAVFRGSQAGEDEDVELF